MNKKAYLFVADITDKNKVSQIFKQVKPDVVNHHAAQISVRNSVMDPQNDAKVNIIGIINILQAGVFNKIKKVIFASSGGVVYGDASQIPTKEDYTPKKPFSPYGITKLASELYLHYYHQTYGIPYVSLRYANIFGPRQNPHGEAGVVAIFSLKLLREKKAIINGDGKQTRDYVYVGDVVNANKQALESDQPGSFNISTGIETNVNQIYQAIASIIGTDQLPVHGSAKKGEQQRSCLDNTRAYRKLNWKPKTDLHQGLQRTVAFFRKYG